MIKKLPLILTVSSMVALSGCASSGGVSGLFSENQIEATSSSQYPATDPATIRIYLSQKPACHYEELGTVTTKIHDLVGIERASADMENDLKANAAKMGGNAIIDLKDNFDDRTGTVIRCVK